MSTQASIEKNNKRIRLVALFAEKRRKINAEIRNKKLSMDERFALVIKRAKMPRNSSRIRVRNRCALTGRPRGYYRDMGLSRNMIRELAGKGMLPGIVKASW